MVHDFSHTHSVIGLFLAELRNKSIQHDRLRFRTNLERIAQCIGYEISKTLSYTSVEVVTPLGIADAIQLNQQPVLATILRAGLPMHNGLLSVFDHSECAFVSAYRRHQTAEKFDIHVEYIAAPNLQDKVLIISDPMLATGNSMLSVIKELQKYGVPTHIHIVSAIAAPEAIQYLKVHLPLNTTFWVGAVDVELTAHSYIVPGIGDAGDIAFGEKH